MIELTNSVFSFIGFVSSKRRWKSPPYCSASPAFRIMDLACPICKYPFGSGGNLVTTLVHLPSLISWSMIFSIKLREMTSSFSIPSFTPLGLFTLSPPLMFPYVYQTYCISRYIITHNHKIEKKKIPI